MAAVTTPGLMVPSMASGTVHQSPLAFWRGFRTCVPRTVSRYLCVVLLGLPGSVTSTGPRSSKHPSVPPGSSPLQGGNEVIYLGSHMRGIDPLPGVERSPTVWIGDDADPHCQPVK